MNQDGLLVRTGDAGSAVAVETAVLTSGLPDEARLDAAERIAAAIRGEAVDPAFIGLIAGRAIVGLEPDELAVLAKGERKLTKRDLPAAIARGQHGGTTVAATIFLACRAGIQVAVTGGIGGVHPAPGGQDVSADLYELSRTPIVVVCSGAKAIVDLAATVERLETLGVCVIGFGTDEFPSFWSAESGLGLGLSADSASEIADFWHEAQALGSANALLVCVPPPPEVALSGTETEAAVGRALGDLDMAGISGPAVTPFLLSKIAEHTGGRSLKANLGLLENNARVAGAIARAVGNVERRTPSS